MIVTKLLQLAAPEISVLVIAGAILGSLIPDIDNRNSTISRRAKGAAVVYASGQMILRIISRIMPKKAGENVRRMIGHRGITHSLLLPTLLMIAGISFQNEIAFSFLTSIAAGMISHIAFDAFSSGAPLFMPVIMKRITLGRIRTGGI